MIKVEQVINVQKIKLLTFKERIVNNQHVAMNQCGRRGVVGLRVHVVVPEVQDVAGGIV
jgi:hypothetical protein